MENYPFSLFVYPTDGYKIVYFTNSLKSEYMDLVFGKLNGNNQELLQLIDIWEPKLFAL
jgi:hypothetical protein